MAGAARNVLRDPPVLMPKVATPASPDSGASVAEAGSAKAPALFGSDIKELVAELENPAARNAVPANLGQPAAPIDPGDLLGSVHSAHSGAYPLVATTAAGSVAAPMVMRNLLDPGDTATVLFFALLLLAIWFAVIFAASRRGWARFASARFVHPAPTGRRYRATYARFGGVFAAYRNVVRVTFIPGGMYFSTPWTFRAFHRPFLIPWSSVKAVRRKNELYRPRYRIDIEDGVGKILVRLSGDVAAELRVSQAMLGKPASHSAQQAEFENPGALLRGIGSGS